LQNLSYGPAILTCKKENSEKCSSAEPNWLITEPSQWEIWRSVKHISWPIGLDSSFKSMESL
jgi:hypothetical protein